jgi:SAM-dependent methyltransferase
VPIIPLAKPFEDGHLDALDVEPSGEIHLYGWTRESRVDPAIELLVDASKLAPREQFRLCRPDVEQLFPSAGANLGFGLAYHAPAECPLRTVEVRSSNLTIAAVSLQVLRIVPDYSHLFDESRVLHRDDIYGYGPPNHEPDLRVLGLARLLPDPILDFGCGSGALVRALLAARLRARGLELRRAEIVASLRDDVRPFVDLYEGEFPLPYPDGRFEGIVCSEVLEHIPDWQGAIAEMGRVGRKALITVPDMSAIPTLFRHRVVPWHLLESTHVNFFTQRSLHGALAKAFSRIDFLRLGEFPVNGTRVYTSLVALCER